jgi:hypothetical protein
LGSWLTEPASAGFTVVVKWNLAGGPTSLKLLSPNRILGGISGRNGPQNSGNELKRSGPGWVQRHYLFAQGRRVSVFGGGDGLVEPLCVGLGMVQQFGQRVLHSGLDERGCPRPNTADLQHRPGAAVYQRGVLGRSGIGGSGRQYGWPGSSDRQLFHRTALWRSVKQENTYPED